MRRILHSNTVSRWRHHPPKNHNYNSSRVIVHPILSNSTCNYDWISPSNRQIQHHPLSSSSSSLSSLSKRQLTTTTTTNKDKGKDKGNNDKKKALAKTLYRQLLRWCDTAGTHIPLDPVPPVTLEPPHVNPSSLLQLVTPPNERSTPTTTTTNRVRTLQSLIPPNSIVTPEKLIVPVRHTGHVEKLIRLAYALNVTTNQEEEEEEEVVKTRISLAFETMKSLNMYNELLEDRKVKREENLDRGNVRFCVGQVVQHRAERWRGVVKEWKRIPVVPIDSPPPNNPKSSLTQKQYQYHFDPNEQQQQQHPQSSSIETKMDKTTQSPPPPPTQTTTKIQYELILDTGDAHLLGRNRTHPKSIQSHVAMEEDLEEVKDLALKRIRSPRVAECFLGFDSIRGRFVPNDLLGFEYPSDYTYDLDGGVGGGGDGDGHNLTRTVERENIDATAKHVVEAVRKVAIQMHRSILDVTSSLDKASTVASSSKVTTGLLASYERRIRDIADGLTSNAADRLEGVNGDGNVGGSDGDDSTMYPSLLSSCTSFQSAVRHLRALLDITLEIAEMSWQRRIADQHSHRIKYPLGTIIRHTKYDFRGVVVGWDPRPTVDVSNWDGLQDVKGNVNEMPFYHVFPDRNDAIKAFGGPRPFRYVCEENLEMCTGDDLGGRLLDVDLDPEEWVLERDLSSSSSSSSPLWKYIPPEELRFKYGENSGQDRDTFDCIQKIRNDLSTFHRAVRDGKKDSDQSTPSLSMDDLFFLLQAADTLDDAIVIQETIKEIWKVHRDEEVRWKLDDGIAELLRGNKEKALTIFDDIIHQNDTNYAEAWNKKATCHYMIGEMQESADAALKVLELNAQHFQALAGLGLVYYDTNRYKESVEAFRKSLKFDPWSPVSSRLGAGIDVLKRLDLDEAAEEDEEGAKEGTAPHYK